MRERLATRSSWAGTAWRLLLALAGLVLMSTSARAVPAFAVQTGQSCNGCHVGGFGPQLTPFGREFKVAGYTLRTNDFNLPVSAMAIASYVRTQTAQAAPAATHFAANDNVAIDQVSLFLAGGVGAHLGGFVQGTYDGVAEAFHWDNLDLRAVTRATILGTSVLFGTSLNNAPTVQDAFNTLPAWGFPYTTSALVPAPAAAPLIGNLAQTTLGLTGYVWIRSEVYVEAGGYWSPSQNFLARAGVDPFDPGNISGVAPYGRLAYQKNFGDWNVEIGAFGMGANLYPARDTAAATTDRYLDLGLDGSLQYFRPNKDVFTLNARFTDERQRLYASHALGLAASVDQKLTDVRLDGSYYWRGKIGLTAGAFNTFGSRDPLLYGSDRTFKPDTAGLNFQIDDSLFGAGASPLGSRFNARIGLQYTAYSRFDGSRRDYDGSGRRASDNNTLRAFIWTAY